MTTKEKIPWILLWDQVQKWYGDIRKEESARQFVERMGQRFKLELTIPIDIDDLENYAKLINNDQI